jgi:hypothetical protein
VHAQGDLVFFSPKAHPEVAGMGIEYTWGAAKLFFRRNDVCNSRRLHGTVHAALKHITLSVYGYGIWYMESECIFYIFIYAR